MRRILAAALVAAAFAATFWIGFVAAPDAEAIKCGFQSRYYSDATYTIQVGGETWWPQQCGCFYNSWGTETAYDVTTVKTCLD